MTGRIIEDDMFGVARRLRSIDDGYFVFFNYKTKKFEVHDKNARGSTLCLVLPYDRLDERTVRRVRATRAERAQKLIEEIEWQNAVKERAAKRAAIEKIEAAADGGIS